MRTIYLYPLNITATPCEFGTFVYAEFIDNISGSVLCFTGTYQAKPYYAVHYLLGDHNEGILTEEDVGAYSSLLYCRYKLLYGYDDFEKFMEE